jgi:ATPase subunit of ABC transporter with duplicated ATPase domains
MKFQGDKMPRIIERYKDNLILCCRCKRYLPREAFFESHLKRNQFDCKECHRKYVNEYNHKRGVKTWEERKKEQEENRQKEFPSDPYQQQPYQQINSTIERLLKARGEYQQKEDHVCGYCDLQATVGLNGKKYCRKHFLIHCLTLGKSLTNTCNLSSEEPQRKIKILEELEKLGVNLD